MDKLIVCNTVKFKEMHTIGEIAVEFCINARCVHRFLAPEGELQLKSREACFYCLVAEPIKSFFVLSIPPRPRMRLSRSYIIYTGLPSIL